MSRVSGSSMSEVGRLKQVVVKHVRDAFVSAEQIANEWRGLNFTNTPHLARAIEEYDQFLELIARSGAEIRQLPMARGVGLDSIYARDASVVTPRGIVLCQMGKTQRSEEPAVQDREFLDWGIPVIGAIRSPGRLEGGDVVWLNSRTVAVGRGYRTNDEGIRQFRALLGDTVDAFLVVPLPHWHGPLDVFHLMSMISPVDHNLAVVYAPLLPVPFREQLRDLGISFVEVPNEEFESMGANVLALAPRDVVVLAGNPRTRLLLEQAGVNVSVYSGIEISLKGGGGPTCLTRPISRE